MTSGALIEIASEPIEADGSASGAARHNPWAAVNVED
jgi:hypothetical protein